jgi:hypothetical protein
MVIPWAEIEDALKAAPSSIRWPKPNAGQIEAVGQEGAGVLDLWRSWRCRRHVWESHTEEIIDRLFPDNPLLCVGRNIQTFRTQRREQWRGELEAHSLIVPSPVTSEAGRSLINTGPRRHLIIEADCGGLKQQAAILWHLAKIAPLAIVVFSGNKSLHGWFFCEGILEERLLRFMKYAVSLGADKMMWLRSQSCRTPDGRRSDGKSSTALQASGWDEIPAGRQPLLYFNPEAIRPARESESLLR